MGAPRKHPAKDAVETIERLAGQGYAIIGIAKNLGVSKETFKKWCEEDGTLQEAFENGRETQRQALIALIVQSAVMNKPANANAMFLLKTMHGWPLIQAGAWFLGCRSRAPSRAICALTPKGSR